MTTFTPTHERRTHTHTSLSKKHKQRKRGEGKEGEERTNDVDHEVHPPRMQCVRQSLERRGIAKVGVEFGDVKRPVATRQSEEEGRVGLVDVDGGREGEEREKGNGPVVGLPCWGRSSDVGHLSSHSEGAVSYCLCREKDRSREEG